MKKENGKKRTTKKHSRNSYLWIASGKAVEGWEAEKSAQILSLSLSNCLRLKPRRRKEKERGGGRKATWANNIHADPTTMSPHKSSN